MTIPFSVDLGTPGLTDVRMRFMKGNTTISTVSTSIVELADFPGIYYHPALVIPDDAKWIHSFSNGSPSIKSHYMIPQTGGVVALSVDFGIAETGRTDVVLQLKAANTNIGSIITAAQGVIELADFPGIYYYGQLATSGGTWVHWYRTGDPSIEAHWMLPIASAAVAAAVFSINDLIDVDICNLALAKIGTQVISSLGDSTQQARYCKRFYLQTLSEVLDDPYPWNFAKHRVTLSRSTTPPDSEWLYAYQLPSDFIRLLKLNAWEPGAPDKNWNISGRMIHTDDEIAEIHYIRLVTDVSSFSPKFIEAVSVKLASNIVTPLTKDRGAQFSLLEQYYKLIKPEAQLSGVNQVRPVRKEPWVNSLMVASRYRGV